ncbi:MAG TPA: RNA polymerase sigma factor [Herbaspirillum sp.]
MSEEAQPFLLDYLARRYANLRERLTRVLGNDDLAGDALHDAWLRLNAREDGDGPIHNPGAYLVRMAVNLAVDVHRRQSRSVSGEEIDAVMEELADPAPGPLQIVEARADLTSLLAILQRMPKRRRHIVMLVHWEGLTQKETARRLKISLRTVETDLHRAHDYLRAYMAARNNNERF